MGRFLFALLRLLLQLTVFVLTGHWPKIARSMPPGGRPARAARAPHTRKAAGALSAPPRRAAIGGEVPVTFGEGPYIAADAVRAALAEGGAPRRAARHGRPPAAPERRRFARALRDPRTMREALILQAAWGGRKGGR